MFDIFKCTKAAVYHNTRRLTPAQIQKETGCTHIIGGYYFNNKSKDKDYFKPFGWLVIDGKTESTDQWRDWGFACERTGAPAMSTDRTKPYFISSRPLLKDGAETVREDTADVAYNAYRQAVGWTEDGHVVLWCEKTRFKMPQLIEKMRSLNCVDALAMDGGGSVQGIFPKGKVTSSRKMPTFLLFWASKEEYEPKGAKPAMTDGIVAYSLKKDGSNKVADKFKVSEFACEDGSDTIFIHEKLPMVLQYIRMRCGRAVIINSAYRTESHNANVGGAAYSQHLYGTAADIKVSGYTPAKLATIAREIMPDWGGVGIYSWGIHVDVRKEKADWKE